MENWSFKKFLPHLSTNKTSRVSLFSLSVLVYVRTVQRVEKNSCVVRNWKKTGTLSTDSLIVSACAHDTVKKVVTEMRMENVPQE